MTDIADEIYEATGILFGATQLAAVAQFIKEREAAARRGGIEAAMAAAHEAWRDGVPPAEIADAIPKLLKENER